MPTRDSLGPEDSRGSPSGKRRQVYEEAIIVAVLLEQNDEWAVQRARYNDPGNHRAAER